jgi:cytochrome c oxidase cbb3-type subunit 3
MSRILQTGSGLAFVAIFGLLSSSAGAQTTEPKRDAGGFPAPTAALERGRTVYVLNACHFCHGIDLTGATMGAADLLHSPLVGADEKGNIIGAVVLSGKPNLQTAMPQYPDLGKAQLEDLAAYIHYLRQVGRYKELAGAAETGRGDASAGQNYFTGNCSECHSITSDLAGVAKKYDAATLRSRLLRPGPAITPDGNDAIAAGRKQHLKLLERYSDDDVHNLMAYLQSTSK